MIKQLDTLDQKYTGLNHVVFFSFFSSFLLLFFFSSSSFRVSNLIRMLILGYVKKWFKDLSQLVEFQRQKSKIPKVVVQEDPAAARCFHLFLNHMVNPFKLIHDQVEFPLQFLVNHELHREIRKE